MEGYLKKINKWSSDHPNSKRLLKQIVQISSQNLDHQITNTYTETILNILYKET